jgi:hypothetical protein
MKVFPGARKNNVMSCTFCVGNSSHIEGLTGFYIEFLIFIFFLKKINVKIFLMYEFMLFYVMYCVQRHLIVAAI